MRVGNAAHGQLQLDVFGEVMDALHQARVNGTCRRANPDGTFSTRFSPISKASGSSRTREYGKCAACAQHFTYSKVMAWVAFDRAIKSAEQFGLQGPLDRWREVAATIHADVCRRGFDAELDSFVQAYGSKQLDASLLLLPSVGFLPPDDARVRGTVRAIERRLLVDGFVLRYDTAAV